MPWRYHQPLDGLRAVAVYLVVLFHAGVGWFGGGFVGVDLFFVLSGFLVSSILLEELATTDSLGLTRFYERRVRRLLPAAVVVVVTTCAIAVIVLSSVRRAPLVGDAQSALLYVANWHFLFASNDYFAAAGVPDSLFLHFWSLSVEEQFYFGFPLLLVLCHRLDRRWRHVTTTTVGLLFLASLAAQVFWAGVDPGHAYYGTETRLYQLLAGALLALGLRRAGGARQPSGQRNSGGPRRRSAALARAIAPLAVTGLVVAATPLVGLSPSTRGMIAILCAVPLLAALVVDDRHPVARLLARPTPVYLGRISYGTYLWHWPVVVLLREVVSPSPVVTAAIVAVLGTALAAASHQLLEWPVRARRVTAPWRLPVVAGGLAVGILTAALVVPTVLEQDHVPDLVASRTASVGSRANITGPVPDLDFVTFARDEGPLAKHCGVDDAADCYVVSGQPGPNVMLVGDSHGRMLQRALADLARTHGFNLSVHTLGGCPWPDELVSQKLDRAGQVRCATARQELYDGVLKASDTDVVVLTQQGRDSPYWSDLMGRPSGGAQDEDETFEELLHDTTMSTLGGIVDDGMRALVVQSIWLPSEEADDPLDCLASSRRVERCRVPISPTPRLLDADYLAAEARWPDVHTVDINPTMCPAAPVCDAVLDGIPVWRDVNHYSPAVILHERRQIWDAIVASGAFDGLVPGTP